MRFRRSVRNRVAESIVAWGSEQIETPWKSHQRDIGTTLARRKPLVEILLDRVEGSTGASEAHVAIRPHEILRGIVDTEACEYLASFVDQHTGLRAATEILDSQQIVASCRVPAEALDVKRIPIAAQHQRQTRPDDSFLKPDDIPIER